MIQNLEQAPPIPGIRKAAILLITLGDQTCSEILKQMDEDEVQAIGREVARLSSITSEQAEMLLEEFYQMTVAHDYVLQGGLGYARKILFNAFGPEHATKMVDRLVQTLGSEVASFDTLQKADPQQVAKFIHNEHPQTIALVLSHLNPLQAAGLLISLPPEMRSDVALRMANLDRISPDIISKIAGIIGMKLKALGEFRDAHGGVRAVSEMFNRLDSSTSKEVLETMEQTHPTLVETIRHLMFVFEDLLLLGPEALKETMARVDRKILTIALKGTSDQLKNHFLEQMSQRGSEMLREDMEALGPIKIREVEAAQQQIIAVVRQLESEGVISLKGTVGEQYVV